MGLHPVASYSYYYMLMCFLDGWVKYYDECFQYVAVVVIAESGRNDWWNIQDGPV